MLAEQIVEQSVLRAAVVVAEPPEPVAALGNVNLPPCLLQRAQILSAGGRPQGRSIVAVAPRLALLLRLLLQVLTGAVQGVPGGVVLLVADPDPEVVGDPQASEQTRQQVLRWMSLQILADRHGLDEGRPRA